MNNGHGLPIQAEEQRKHEEMKIVIECNSLKELVALGKAVQTIKFVDESASIKELGFAVRTQNCLLADNISTVGELVGKDEMALLRVPNLGRNSLQEIREVLKERGLRLLGD